MDPQTNGDAEAAPQIELAIIFRPFIDGRPGGELEVRGIPDAEPQGYWLLKKLEILMDQFYAQRNTPKIVPGGPQMHPAMAEFLRNGGRRRG